MTPSHSAVETVARRSDEAREVEAAEVAARGGRPFHTTGHQVAAGSLAALLHVAPRTMSTRVDRARRVVCQLPDVQRLAWAGELEPYRVDAIVRESAPVNPARLHEFEARLLEADITALPTSQLRRRARDWAQTRPEWGLAGNAAFIAAPRARTRAVDLEGRAFLHDYDWRQDQEGKVLELIMTAPMVVAGSVGRPGLKRPMRSRMRSTTASWISRCKKARLVEPHDCPHQVKFMPAMAASATSPGSASG